MKTYLVGGAVRDTYLKKPVSDRDYVVVGATPEDLLSQGFEQVGAAFPVFLHPHTGEEYALARSEKKVGEGYLGFETNTDNVTLEEDLARRDFTINAMAIDTDTANLIDPHGGFKDLKDKILRHVGPAFREDPLRVVRMARFLGKLCDDGFTVADETFDLAKEMVRNGELNELSWERFAAEVVKVLDTCSPDGCYTFFDVLNKLGCSQHVSFFAGVDMLQAAKVAKLVKKELVESARPAALAAMSFGQQEEQATHIGGSLGRDVGRLLFTLESVTPSAELAYVTLKKSGAWHNSPTWTVLTACLHLGQLMGHFYAFTWTQLLHAEAVTTPVACLGASLAKAGISGAAIGEFIRTARLEALRKLDLT